MMAITATSPMTNNCLILDYYSCYRIPVTNNNTVTNNTNNTKMVRETEIPMT